MGRSSDFVVNAPMRSVEQVFSCVNYDIFVYPDTHCLPMLLRWLSTRTASTAASAV